MMPSRKNKWLIALGVLVSGVGVLLASVWTTVFYSKVRSMMVLKNGSMSYEIWRDIPIPIYLECFIFNITNVDDILAKNDVKLHVEQLGPYVFREIHKKVNITWNANSTVTYKNQRWWYFQPEMSNGSLADLVTNINPIIATIAYTLRNQNTMLKIFVDYIIRQYHSNLFITANVSSWLFDGIQDPLLDFANSLPYVPYKIPFDRFGWLYTRNGSTDVDGLIVSYTGEADFKQLGNTELWQHKNQTIFKGQCGEVKGSSGELWALEPDQEEIQVFAPDLCTYITLKKTGPVTRLGIPGVEFATNDSIFDNGYKYPSMACYCDEERGKDCMPSGILNVSMCHFGAPAFVTLPHFYGADPYYLNKIEGLEPKEAYNFKMTIEPETGMPLHVAAQMQVSALVRHIPGLSVNNQLPDPDTLVPMFWFREDIEMNEEYANFARVALDVRYGMPYVFYVLILTGTMLLFSGIWFSRSSKFSVSKKEIDRTSSQTFLKRDLQR